MIAATFWAHQTTRACFTRSSPEFSGISLFDDEPDAPQQVAIYYRNKAGEFFPARTVDMETEGHAESVLGAWLSNGAGKVENLCADPVIRARVADIIAGADERAAADRLAAAAPELLAALQRLLEYTGGWYLKDPEHPIVAARIAVARAEGRAS